VHGACAPTTWRWITLRPALRTRRQPCVHAASQPRSLQAC